MTPLSSVPHRQRGVVLVLFTIAMVAMLGMAGLALDGAHSMLNKTRLQNTVDAAALSAAKTLDQTNDRVVATVEALAMFWANASGAGNNEIAASYSSGQLTVSVQYSTTLHPFVPGSVPERYVRVTATNLRLPGWLIPVLGVDEMVVGASAVAGPSPTIDTACNLVPMMVCGDPLAAPEDNFGFTLNQPDVIKASNNSFEVGPGNFQLLRLGGGMGGNDIRHNMAGGFNGCIAMGDTLSTEPGNTVGPVTQGLNTRFGEYSGPLRNSESQYPPDVILTEPSSRLTYDSDTDTILHEGEPVTESTDYYNYSSYKSDILSGSFATPIEEGGVAAFNRRILTVPIGDCSNQTNGQGELPLLGFLCYHLIQTAEQHGNRSEVYGQFVNGCSVTGQPGPAPGAGPGPYIIQLYKDETAEAA